MTLTTRGPRKLTATYAGDGNFSASSMQTTHHVNRLPVAPGGNYATNEDVPLSVSTTQGVLANASDPDGDALTVPNTGTLTASGIGGAVVLNANGGFSYTPPLNASGAATFDFVVSDGHETVTATATITVNAVNHPPSFVLAAAPTWAAGENGLKTQAGFATVTGFGPPNEVDQHALAWHVRSLGDPNGAVTNLAIAPDGTLT